MKTKITQSIPALIALVFIGFSYFSQWCAGSGQICFRTIVDRMIPGVTFPLYFFSLFFLPVAIILIFIPRHLFISWLKLAVWMIPLLLILVATQPVNATHILSTNRDDAAGFAGQVFSIISLVLLTWKFISTRSNKS